ncbi:MULTISPECIES: uroporphyrinogen-III synthase [Thioalkalivibrio]|uniref:uroporphyrinogen-III synthase n=1 Tax=Thioalkalivibrio TaxID=106633 RepID=UPI00038274D1|nr:MULTISPECIES: uroporphyrinogen-III synthase [Thioalkalivibrio]OOC50570.1 uroporphyrinogen III synthase HEM4 [Thioalkalivibrio versutus]
MSGLEDRTHAVSGGLAGVRVALPESRALEVFAGLLERRGAEVWRCPLVAIHDSLDQAAIESWLATAIDAPFDRLIFLTGEGFTRLTGFARRAGCEATWLTAVAGTPTLVRGPKPGRAMKPFGVRPDAVAAAPTTEGIIQTLSAQDLHGQRIGVQLYGAEPNRRLLDFLRAAGAEVFLVWPYRYADAAETGRVSELIAALIAGEVDAIAFTSQAQVRRLLRVGQAEDRQDALREALRRTIVAAIGPVVADELHAHGITPTVVPDGRYFMKPLVSALARHLQAVA